MGVEELFEEYEGPLKKIGEQLEEFTNSLSEVHTKRLAEYFLRKEGHRLRPLLCLIAYECVTDTKQKEKGAAATTLRNIEARSAEPLVLRELYKRAAALELLHSASLLHDDVIDAEIERRDQPSINLLKGNKTAVLLGNVFYLNAFRLIVEPLDMRYYEMMLDTSMNMCQGEILQAEKGDADLKLEEYLNIIKMKTAKLIELSCMYGAATAGVCDEIQKQVSRLGMILGLFYQIRDDKKDKDVHFSFGTGLEVEVERLHCEFEEILKSLKKEGCFIKHFEMIEKKIRPVTN